MQNTQQTPLTTAAGNTAFSARVAAKNPALAHKLRQMALPLAPLVQLTTGRVAPCFPANVLSFWLLTDAQLDALAAFYHQRTPSAWTAQYPCPVWPWCAEWPIKEKRRKIGKFIGLSGCDTPEGLPAWLRAVAEQDGREIEERAREAREVAEREEELFRRKMGWY